MLRIRNVKPELFTHEGLYECERRSGLPCRVAFIAMFTVADREGRFRWQPRVLKLYCLPYDELDFEEVLLALAEGGFVRKYEVDGRQYGVIPGFLEHQRFNQREPHSKLPPPPTPEEISLHVQAHASPCMDMHARSDDVHARGERGREREREGQGNGQGNGQGKGVSGETPEPPPPPRSLQMHTHTENISDFEKRPLVLVTSPDGKQTRVPMDDETYALVKATGDEIAKNPATVAGGWQPISGDVGKVVEQTKAASRKARTK